MVSLDWSTAVEVETLDGRPLGPARLRLWGFMPGDRSERWRGELDGALLDGAKPWPEHEPVRLRLPSRGSITVGLETGTREVGPTLQQVARVSAGCGQLKGLVLGSLVEA
jgi:hypothetical protein